MKKPLASRIGTLVALVALPSQLAFCQGMQAPNAPGSAPSLAAQNCVSCHGPGLTGGRAQSLVDDRWSFGGDDKSIAASIRDGRAEGAMPSFKATLSESQILALVTYIHEEGARGRLAAAPPKGPEPGDVVKSEKHAFKIELVADGLDTPWGMAFLPDGRMLVTRAARPPALHHAGPAAARAGHAACPRSGRSRTAASWTWPSIPTTRRTAGSTSPTADAGRRAARR